MRLRVKVACVCSVFYLFTCVLIYCYVIGNFQKDYSTNGLYSFEVQLWEVF